MTALPPLALLGNLDFSEVVLIGIAAVLIFGRRLPEVAGQVARGLGQARRALEELWRESGLEREVDEVRRQVEDARRGLPRLDSGTRLARSLIERAAEPHEPERVPREGASSARPLEAPDPAPAPPDNAGRSSPAEETRAEPGTGPAPARADDAS